MLHFGTVLHANENVSDDLKNWVTNFLTPYEGELEGNLIEKCFVDEKFDFNITNKIWRRKYVKRHLQMLNRSDWLHLRIGIFFPSHVLCKKLLWHNRKIL